MPAEEGKALSPLTSCFPPGLSCAASAFLTAEALPGGPGTVSGGVCAAKLASSRLVLTEPWLSGLVPDRAWTGPGQVRPLTVSAHRPFSGTDCRQRRGRNSLSLLSALHIFHKRRAPVPFAVQAAAKALVFRPRGLSRPAVSSLSCQAVHTLCLMGLQCGHSLWQMMAVAYCNRGG